MNALKSVDWNDARKKLWLLLLMAGAAYAQTDSRFAFLVPVLTGMAGVSQPPSGVSPTMKVLIVGTSLGLGVRML